MYTFQITAYVNGNRIIDHITAETGGAAQKLFLAKYPGCRVTIHNCNKVH